MNEFERQRVHYLVGEHFKPAAVESQLWKVGAVLVAIVAILAVLQK